MESPLIDAIGLGFSYRKPVLDGFGLQLAGGRVALLLGLNGAGKTTALRLLSGQRLPAEGRVRIAGGDPRRAAVRRHLYYLPETSDPPLHLDAEETVRLHVALYRRHLGRDGIRAILHRLGLGTTGRKRAETFSKGMRRRLELACLLAADPDVWLLDEPQAGLDPLGLRLLTELCLEARGRGRAVVMATHTVQDVQALADDVVLLRDGRTVFSGTRADLIAAVDARAYVFEGGGAGLEAALRGVAVELSAGMLGPRIPPEAVERLLFEERTES